MVARMTNELILKNTDGKAAVVVQDVNRPERSNTFELTPGMSLAYCAEPNNEIPRELHISVAPEVVEKQPAVVISNAGKSPVLVQQDDAKRQDYGVRYCLELQPGCVAMYPRQTRFKVVAPEPPDAPKAELPLAAFKNTGDTLLEFQSDSRTLKVLPGGIAYVNHKTQTNVRAVMTDEHGRQVDFKERVKALERQVVSANVQRDAAQLLRAQEAIWAGQAKDELRKELADAKARVESLEAAVECAQKLDELQQAEIKALRAELNKFQHLQDALTAIAGDPALKVELVNDCVEKAKQAITDDVRRMSRWT